jgi:enoyl-CoA hydratase/carnithine racemase
MGLVWQVVPHDDLLAEAWRLAERLCQSAPLAVRATKEVAIRAGTLPWVEAVRFGETMRLVVGSTADAAEGRAAIREKHSPQWQGR